MEGVAAKPAPGWDRRYYGSDRDENPSTAQSEREWREWLQSQRQGGNQRYYGSDREAGPTTAQGEREWRAWLQSQRQSDNGRRFGSDRYAANDAATQDGLRKFFDENWSASDSR